MTDWQPMDTAPRDGRSVLLWFRHYGRRGGVPRIAHWDGAAWANSTSLVRLRDPLCWAAITEPDDNGNESASDNGNVHPPPQRNLLYATGNG